MPLRAKVIRDGRKSEIDAVNLVPGDVLVIEEGDRISADARLFDGGIEVDMSALTGESMPTFRSADLVDTTVPVLHARELVFSGTTCTEGKPAEWCSPPACIPSWAESQHFQNESNTTRARSSTRSGAWPG